MAEINANIVVEPIDLTVVSTENQINVNVDSTNIGVYTSAPPSPGGNAGELQYNYLGSGFNGIPNVTYDGSNLTLGDVDQVKITGGTNAYFLQTDGTGNLIWSPGTANVSGNGTAAGSNGQIQFSDGAGNFVADANLNWNNTTNPVSGKTLSTKNLNVYGNINWYTPIEGIALGPNASANSTGGTAFGANATANSNGGTAYGYSTDAQGAYTIAMGYNSTAVNSNAVAIGTLALANGQESVSIGHRAGTTVGSAGARRVAIGSNAGWGSTVGTFAADIAIGYLSGRGQEGSAIAIGESAGANVQKTEAIAIGRFAGALNQGRSSIAVGVGAGQNAQGNYSLAIGYASNADNYGTAVGYYANAPANTTVITSANASQLTLGNGLVVSNLQQQTTSNVMFYDPATGNITYDTLSGPASPAAGSNTEVQFNSSGALDADSSFTFDVSTNNLTVDGNIVVSNGAFHGNGAFINYLDGGAVSGTVALANIVTDNAQPNITSVGTLTSLAITGDLTSANGNVSLTNGNVQASNIIANNNVQMNNGNVNNQLTVGGNIFLTGSNQVYLKMNPTNYANLPSASSQPGARAMIDDYSTSSPVFGTTVSAGGGIYIAPVWSDGSVWRIG